MSDYVPGGSNVCRFDWPACEEEARPWRLRVEIGKNRPGPRSRMVGIEEGRIE